MYQNFYHLKKEPFHITPDPEFLFLTPSHKQALGSIVYGVRNRKGFVVITGEVGVGKTTILRSYLEGVAKQKTKIIYIFNANVTFENLLKSIYRELGLHTKKDDTVEMLNDLYQILMEEYKQGNTVLLIIDEAQNMPIKTLENLRMLSNLETSKDKLLQIVLIGQYEFEKILDLYELRQLKQRIAIRSTIIPFTGDESMAYIKHRLAKVTINRTPIFTKGALKRIVKEAKGVPRSLNILCDNALITGFGYKIKPVNTKIVNEVITDFKGEEKPSLLKWVLPPAALILFIVGLFLIYPYKGVILSKLENFISPYKSLFISKAGNPDLSRAEELNPIKEEVKPPGENTSLPQTHQTDPVKEEIEPSKGKTIPEPSQTSPPVIRTLEKGDSLYKLTRKVYGYADDKLVARVKQNNPWIKDIDKIPVGSEIIFPEISENQAKGKVKDKVKE
jgi:general secretion pathway protein A